MRESDLQLPLGLPNTSGPGGRIYWKDLRTPTPIEASGEICDPSEPDLPCETAPVSFWEVTSPRIGMSCSEMAASPNVFPVVAKEEVVGKDEISVVRAIPAAEESVLLDQAIVSVVEDMSPRAEEADSLADISPHREETVSLDEDILPLAETSSHVACPMFPAGNIVQQAPKVFAQPPVVVSQAPVINLQTPGIALRTSGFVPQASEPVPRTPGALLCALEIVPPTSHFDPQAREADQQGPENIPQMPYIIGLDPEITPQASDTFEQAPGIASQASTIVPKDPEGLLRSLKCVPHAPAIVPPPPEIALSNLGFHAPEIGLFAEKHGPPTEGGTSTTTCNTQESRLGTLIKKGSSRRSKMEVVEYCLLKRAQFLREQPGDTTQEERILNNITIYLSLQSKVRRISTFKPGELPLLDRLKRFLHERIDHLAARILRGVHTDIERVEYGYYCSVGLTKQLL